MSRKTFKAMLLTGSLSVALIGGTLHARGFGGGGGRGGGGGGGFRGGGGYGGGGQFRGGGGYGGGGYGGGFDRTPSFSPSRSNERPGGYGGGTSQGYRGSAEGMNEGQINYGTRSGSYDTARGGTIDYGAAGAAGRGAEGGVGARGAYGVSRTTAGGRSYADVGRAGAAVGPDGRAVAGRSSAGIASGPNGTVAGRSSAGIASGANGRIAGRSYSAGAYRANGFNAYGGYHDGWVHGYWNGHDNAAWGWRSPYWGTGFGVGMGLGWGLSSWGFGSSLYGMGYMPYSNPYYDGGGAVGGGQPVYASPYDYSQPIDTVSAAAPEAVSDPAMALFDSGRASFKQGDYAGALTQTDSALAKLPGDTTLHEFRGLCLFALGRYDESATALYAVLSVGPGWDWTTMIGLYPDVDTYTAQLRALEAFATSHPDSAPGRFVLAYQYLTQGHSDAAVEVLKQVVALKPGDALSAKLLRQLEPPPTATATAATAPAADTTPPQGATVVGTWNAKPAADTSIVLTVQPGGAFTWSVTQKGQDRQFGGSSTYGDGILTLVQDKGPALVGRVGWADANHMTFRIVGDGPDDPGLSFAR